MVIDARRKFMNRRAAAALKQSAKELLESMEQLSSTEKSQLRVRMAVLKAQSKNETRND